MFQDGIFIEELNLHDSEDDNNGAAIANLQAASSFACVGSESTDTDGDANKAALPGAPTDNNGDITMTA